MSDNRWQFDVDTEITFDETGSQVEVTKRTYHREYASWLREQMSMMSKKEKGEWLTQLYQESVTESSSPSFSIIDEALIDQPLIIESTTSYQVASDPNEDLQYTEAAYWVRHIARSLTIGNQHYGAHFPGFKATSKIEFKFHDLWQDVDGSAHVDFDSKFGKMERRFASGQDSIKVATWVSVPQRHIKADEIEAFNRFLGLIGDEAIFTLYGKSTAGER